MLGFAMLRRCSLGKDRFHGLCQIMSSHAGFLSNFNAGYFTRKKSPVIYDLERPSHGLNKPVLLSHHANAFGCNRRLNHVLTCNHKSVEVKSGNQSREPLTNSLRDIDDFGEANQSAVLSPRELPYDDSNPTTKVRKMNVSKHEEVCQYHPLDSNDWPIDPDVPYVYMSRLFHEVEAESRRIPNINRIANFFRSVIAKSPESLLSVIYLCINKLGPDYKGMEIGVGDSLLLKVLSQRTGKSVKELSEELKTVGDLGEIAERSSCQTRSPSTPLTVCHVFRQFGRIASETKVVSKLELISDLLGSCSEAEARFIVRSLQGNLRIGCSIPTVLAALAKAVVLTPPLSGSERNRLDDLPAERFNRSLVLEESLLSQEIAAATAILKKTWVECPNFTRIIPALLQYPIHDINKHCFLTPGVPINCMLAAPAKSVSDVLEDFDNHDIVLEYKYDGERVQIHVLEDGNVHIFSRNAEMRTEKFPDIVDMISKTFSRGMVQSCIIDAEAVAYCRSTNSVLPFQVLSTRKRKDVKTEDIDVDICLFAFDLIFLNGTSLLSVPLRERRRLLHSSFNEIDGYFRFTISKETNDEAEMTQFLDQSIAQNCEGLMVKCLDAGQLALYEPDKRSRAWKKLKRDYMEGLTDSFDLVPIGAYYGKGRRTGTFGGYLLAVYDPESEELQSVCKIGTGFNDEMLKSLTDWATKNRIEAPLTHYRYSERDPPDEWLNGSQVWEIKAANLSVSPLHKAATGRIHAEKGIALRFPRFVQVRFDKRPEDATSSSQIVEFYHQQHKR